jgi:hypothetical protein
MPQPTPPVLVEAFAINAPNASPASPMAGGKTNPFPSASQIGVVNGAASLNDGFVPLNFTPIAGGGVAPFGEDMNGILYLLSAHLAALNAGQLYVFSAVLSAAMTGYGLGARLQQTADSSAIWINKTANNTTNPDTAAPLGSTGWISSKPLNVAVAPAAGTFNDVTVAGGSDYIYDVNTAAGNITYTGVVSQRDGQRITFRKVSADANTFSLSSLTGSAAGNQFQIIAAGYTIATQYDSITLIYNSTVGKWVKA